jgi:hypothetical protein
MNHFILFYLELFSDELASSPSYIHLSIILLFNKSKLRANLKLANYVEIPKKN